MKVTVSGRFSVLVFSLKLLALTSILLRGEARSSSYFASSHSDTCSKADPTEACYLTFRESLLSVDGKERTGSKIVLTEKEMEAEKIIAKVKAEDIWDSVNRGYSYSSRPLREVKSKIERTKMFEILRALPKGCELHVHDATMASFDWLVGNVTYRDDCYLCFDHKLSLMLFRLSNVDPPSTESCEWIKCQQKRKESGSSIFFDYQLYTNFTVSDMNFSPRSSPKEIWVQFEKLFLSIGGLLSEVDVFKEYYRRGLQEFMDDNIQCVEVRAVLAPLYSANGTVYNSENVPLRIYNETTWDFVNQNKDNFYGARIIYSSRRYKHNVHIRASILNALALKHVYPELLAGFDLVGHENSGHPLLYYVDELLLPTRLNVSLPFYLHAGETSWEDPQVETNLIDALLLNSSRIGHGLTLTRHPYLRKRLQQKNIAVEVCPISNQALGLITNLNDHPASVFLSEGHPMTVSSDDPAAWGAKGTSYDWYYVFMGMTQHSDGLRLLKQLAQDSIRYSSFEDSFKEQMLRQWAEKWDKFIDYLIQNFK